MKRRTPVLLALSTVTLLTGCGPHTDLRLDLRAVSITVPRLITPAVELVPVPAVAPPVALPALAALPVIRRPAPLVAPPAAAAVPVPAAVAPPTQRCPKADPFAVPERELAQTVDGPPAAQTFLQTASGAYAGGAGTPDKGSLAGDVEVTVTVLASETSTLGQQLDSWQVLRTDKARNATVLEAYRFVHPSTAPGATAGGVYLVGLAWSDSVRGDLAFEPAGSGLQILPSPVQQAQAGFPQYAGTGTDPGSLTTLALTRDVRGVSRVDVCGTLVDAYAVEMSGTLTTQDRQYQLTWTLDLALGYGPTDVRQNFTISSVADGFTWTRALQDLTTPKVSA